MKIHPKDIKVNLPIVLTFENEYDIPKLASDFNSIIHGKVKLKYDHLGALGNQYVAIFYLQRNLEYQQLRKEFLDMIDKEERENLEGFDE